MPIYLSEMSYPKRSILIGTFIVFFALFSKRCAAHSLVVSTYHLKFKDNTWILSFKQETGSLRDAIYAINPELRGANLNSKSFLDTTREHIATVMRFEIDGEILNISPRFMRYGGRHFTGEFVVTGLEKNPKGMDIKTTGFEYNEHASRLLTITSSGNQFRHQFHEVNKAAYFDFSSETFSQKGNDKKSGATTFLIIVATLLVLVVHSNVLKPKLLL